MIGNVSPNNSLILSVKINLQVIIIKTPGNAGDAAGAMGLILVLGR